MIALVDCNSFYTSCEKVFNPKLRNKPVVVLSNNDGCIIARSDEAKKLKIPMGIPYFKVKSHMDKHHVYSFSSNYTLYGDLSSRVIKTLSEFTPELEVYSIDEAFLNLKGFENINLYEYGKLIQHTVKKNIGLPVSIGIGPTKVLAKIANHAAKKNKKWNGVCVLNNSIHDDAILASMHVDEVWGIGKESYFKLKDRGIHTALDLKRANEKNIQKILTITGRRILKELNGVPCLDFEIETPEKKQIMCSRSFGKRLSDLSSIKEAVATYVTRASEKLRDQKLVCQNLQVFLHNDPFGDHYYYNITSIQLPTATSATHRLIAAAFIGLDQIFKSKIFYKKAGVILYNLTPENQAQVSLFQTYNLEKDDKLIKAFDCINKKIGKDTIRFASCGIEKNWQMLNQMKSPNYTTNWKEILTIKN